MSAPSRGPRLSPRLLTVRLLLLGAGLATAVLLAVSHGVGDASPWDLLPGAGGLDAIQRVILLEVRLPRVLWAGLLGGALTVAGVVFQAFLRNPLADPYVLGVSGGASIGGVIAVLLGLHGAGVPVLAFVTALASLLIIERVATIGGRLTVYTVLLTGAIFNAFSAALIYFVQSLASLEELHAIVFYLMGRIPSLGFGPMTAMGAVVALALAVLLALSRDYNALSLGEESAMQLGVDVERTKRITFVLGSLLTALAVSVAGMIGFVGLVVPHMLRLSFGPDHRLLIPAGFLGGATFLVLADLVARVVLAPNELPVGVVTALIGGPFFLVLLRRRGIEHGSV